jgi:hypothetical protein
VQRPTPPLVHNACSSGCIQPPLAPLALQPQQQQQPAGSCGTSSGQPPLGRRRRGRLLAVHSSVLPHGGVSLLHSAAACQAASERMHLTAERGRDMGQTWLTRLIVRAHSGLQRAYNGGCATPRAATASATAAFRSCCESLHVGPVLSGSGSGTHELRATRFEAHGVGQLVPPSSLPPLGLSAVPTPPTLDGPPPDQHGQHVNFLIGCVAGVASKTASSPLSRVSILMQTQVIRGSAPGEAGVGILGMMRMIVARDGAFGLFRGNLADVLRAAPYTGTQPCNTTHPRLARFGPAAHPRLVHLVWFCNTLSFGLATHSRLVLQHTLVWFCNTLSFGFATHSRLVLQHTLVWFSNTLSFGLARHHRLVRFPLLCLVFFSAFFFFDPQCFNLSCCFLTDPSVSFYFILYRLITPL